MSPAVRSYLRPAFLVCVAILATAAAGMDALLGWMGAVLEKEPIALRQDLNLLDEHLLAPYHVVERVQLTAKVEEELGTTDYIQWRLEDTEAEPDSLVRYCTLFITYYGRPDRVPHVPEECYLGGGYRQTKSQALTLEWQDASGTERQVPIRYLVFVRDQAEAWTTAGQHTVMYVFRVNDRYANDRTEARAILGMNLTGKHSYFSKVEWSFEGVYANRVRRPTLEQSIAASEKLMPRLLDILEREHWPRLSAEITPTDVEQERQ
jgi:hypothetical protein